MSDLICDTSAIQYLHQTQLLYLLRDLGGAVYIPPAVEKELKIGADYGVDLPVIGELRWISVKHPAGERDTSLVGDMGPGEAEVMMLVLEEQGSVAILDDALARKRAMLLDIPFTGTLGILLDAKKCGFISEIAPVLDKLEALRFRIAAETRRVVLTKAGEV